ncbi:MAG TPA: type II toxin-antitoxin system VapC family toxin [Acidimicrobiales bacterium]|jgi:predicted nucleic acid-binding protein
MGDVDGPLQFMVDGNIADALIADPEAEQAVVRACEVGHLVLFTTHVQLDEMGRAPVDKRDRLLGLPWTKMPTSDFVLDVSKLGEARLGDGVTVEAIRGQPGKRTNDALIGATADLEGVVLVTNDVDLTKRARRNHIRVIDSAEFIARVRAM